MKLWFRGLLRATLMLTLLVGGPTAWAKLPPPNDNSGNGLIVRIPQEGDPEHPRLLILIHGVQPLGDLGQNGSDSTWGKVLDRVEGKGGFLIHWWGDRDKWMKKGEAPEDKSWALRQYCSIATFTYDAGPKKMKPAPDVAKDLLQSLNQGWVASDIILVGHSNGGLVARELATIVDRKRFPVRSIVFLASPLDGEVVVWAQFLKNLTNSLKRFSFKSNYADGYLWIPNHLASPSERDACWRTRYKAVHTEIPNYVGFGTQTQVTNVTATLPLLQYGRGFQHRSWKASKSVDDDGAITKSSAMGTFIGPQYWQTQIPTNKPVFFPHTESWTAAFPDILHCRLPHTEEFLQWVTYPYDKITYDKKASPDKVSEVIDSVILTDYLRKREAIERYCQTCPIIDEYGDVFPRDNPKGALIDPENYSKRFYWDPQLGSRLDAYATPEQLHNYLWANPFAGAWEKIDGKWRNGLVEAEIAAAKKRLELKEAAAKTP